MTDQRLNAVSSLVEELHEKYPDHGFKIHPALEFASRDGPGIVVQVKEPVEKEEILLVIPTQERITFGTVAANVQLQPSNGGGENVSLEDLVRSIGEKVDAEINEVESKDITLAVLIMYALVNETRFASFIDTWPSKEELDNQLLFDEDAMDGMSGTYAEYLLALNRQVIERIYEEILFPALEQAKVSHHFVNQDAPRGELFEAFQYAFAIGNSRCHNGSDDGVSADVIPLVDLFNGLPQGSKDLNVELSLGKWPFLRGSVYLDEMDLSCSAVWAKRNLEPGEELFISYGELPPCAFLYKYGVCPEQFLRERLTADVTALWYPPEMAPAEDDANRLKALADSGFPTTPDDIEDSLVFYLHPQELVQYQADLNGIGEGLRSYEESEPQLLKVLRQYIMLAVLADNDSVDHFLKTKNLKGNFNLQEIGRFVLQVVDYNLESLQTETSSIEELKLLKDDGLSEREKSAVICRICYRETLAQWRHVICRRYGIFSAADDSKVIRQFLNIDYMSVPEPPSLQGGGCSVCGRTIGILKCARCKEIQYCSKEHQKGHWKSHKPLCLPITSQKS